MVVWYIVSHFIVTSNCNL